MFFVMAYRSYQNNRQKYWQNVREKKRESCAYLRRTLSAFLLIPGLIAPSDQFA